MLTAVLRAFSRLGIIGIVPVGHFVLISVTQLAGHRVLLGGLVAAQMWGVVFHSAFVFIAIGMLNVFF
ncbi:MAG: hypothetical protein ABI164_11800 [Acidobacteriaceae bacterium]